MTSHRRLDAALNRLSLALDHLESASAPQIAQSAGSKSLTDELGALRDDHARVCRELERARARAKSLELAQDEALRRVKGAEAAIKSILAKNGQADNV
jgi:hypothetical protein